MTTSLRGARAAATTPPTSAFAAAHTISSPPNRPTAGKKSLAPSPSAAPAASAEGRLYTEPGRSDAGARSALPANGSTIAARRFHDSRGDLEAQHAGERSAAAHIVRITGGDSCPRRRPRARAASGSARPRAAPPHRASFGHRNSRRLEYEAPAMTPMQARRFAADHLLHRGPRPVNMRRDLVAILAILHGPRARRSELCRLALWGARSGPRAWPRDCAISSRADLQLSLGLPPPCSR